MCRLCTVELCMKKDSYPVFHAKSPQQKLAGKKFDLRNRLLLELVGKTVFCPGPSNILWEFTKMPHGFTGAKQTCKRGLDNILQSCKDCVDNYVDNCETHIKDLGRVLSHLSAAGLTLYGSKCFLGKSKTTHLGFECSADGVALSTKKRMAWPVPKRH